jgi:hypothetical protein
LDNSIVDVLGDSNSFRVVWREGPDLSNEVLIEEDLADVCNSSTGECTVLKDREVEMTVYMHLGATTDIVTWEYSIKLGHAIGIRGLQSTKEAAV